MTKIIPFVSYALKSIPGRNVQLPEEAVKQADDLIRMIVESEDSMDLIGMMEANHYSKDTYNAMDVEEGLLRKANYLRKSKVDSVRSLSFKDDIYFGISLDYLTKDRAKLFMTRPFREAIDSARTDVIRNMCDVKGARERLNLYKEKK